MQMFRQPIQRATQGDRLGICVTQLDPHLVERCLVASPGYLHAIYGIGNKINTVTIVECLCSSNSCCDQGLQNTVLQR